MDCHFGKERMAVANPGGRFSLCPMIAGGAASDVLASRAWIDCRRPGKRLVRFGDRFGIMPEKFAQLLAHEREGVPSRRCMKRSAAIVAATAQAKGARDGADQIRCGSSPNVLIEVDVQKVNIVIGNGRGGTHFASPGVR